MTNVIGIDLGTCFSAVSFIDDTGRPKIVHNEEGDNMTPSCVLFEKLNKVIVGEAARRSWGTRDSRAVARFKRNMGTSKQYKIDDEHYTPTDLSALVLKKLAADTNMRIGGIGEAVITIPANFSHEQRDATMAAAKAAGLDVRFIINEPTAAALFYGFAGGEELNGVYAVYDLGGGTFDISIIRVDGQEIEVLSTYGVSRLGGDDFDAAIQELVRSKFRGKTGEELKEGDFTKNEAEEEKKSLSKRDKVKVRVMREMIEITRQEFEEKISTYIEQTAMLCEGAVEEAGIDFSDIKAVFLAGGSTRIPAVLSSVKRVFGREPVARANVDEVVALGAALYAAYKGDGTNLTPVQKNAISKIKVSESTGMCYGTLSVTHDQARDKAKLANTILIRKGEKIPCSVTESFYTMHDGQEGVDCEVTESVAPETDPRFVNIICSDKLSLPSGRPAGQEIKVTFAYDDNQIMKCSFVDSATGRETKINLSVSTKERDGGNIDRFLVE